MNHPPKPPEIETAVEQLKKIIEEERRERAREAEEESATPAVYEAFRLEMGQERSTA